MNLLTFRTKYEIGLEKSLSKLDRTTYLYKSNGLIILHLQVDLDPHPNIYSKISNFPFRMPPLIQRIVLVEMGDVVSQFYFGVLGFSQPEDVV